MTTVHVHIDRLVLTGLPVDRRAGPAIREAVAAELARLFAAGGVPPAADAAVVRAAPVAAPPGGPPEALGAAIARSVHGGLRS
jgi:hypothetical protein